MTKKAVRETLASLKKSLRENTPKIERMIKKAGKQADPALVYSAAKYYKTLKKLAKD